MTAAGAMTTGARALLTTGDDTPVTTPRLPAREAAERELSKTMYHEHDPSPLQRALDRFWEWVNALFDAAAGATPGGALGLAVIAGAALLLVLALRIRLGPLRRPRTTGGELFDGRPRTAAEHRSAAERHAADQRWDQAVQERMRALVRALEERGLLDPRPGRTADEATTEAGRPLPEHADRLRSAARAFDDVAYGGRDGTAEAYGLLRDLDEDLRQSTPRLTTTSARAAPGGPV